jgi:hypothetical protein
MATTLEWSARYHMSSASWMAFRSRTQPALKITCVVMPLTQGGGKTRTGYASSVAVASADDHLITHLVQAGRTIESVAHEIAVTLDGTVIEEMRRTAKPASSP